MAIDLPLLLFVVGGGIACFLIGFVFGKFSRGGDVPTEEDLKIRKSFHPCETLEDIIKREE